MFVIQHHVVSGDSPFRRLVLGPNFSVLAVYLCVYHLTEYVVDGDLFLICIVRVSPPVNQCTWDPKIVSHFIQQLY